MKHTTPEGFVYVIHAISTTRIKIGFSLEPEKRLAELQTGSPFQLALIGSCPGSVHLERRMHEHLKDHRCVGEWFEFDPDEALRILPHASTSLLQSELSIYDLPKRILDARFELQPLLDHPDTVVQATAKRVNTLLSKAVMIMGREDVGALILNGPDEE